jgi:hypothetical protein
MRFRKILAAAAALVAVPAAVALGASTASAATSVTSVTHVVNNLDSGNGGLWANDSYDRTLAVTVAADQSGVPAGSVRYTASVSDAGTFVTIPGAFTPNQVVPGQHIAHVVDGTFTGGALYTIVAPAADVLTSGNVVANLNDGFTHPTSPSPQSTPCWPVQAFVPAIPCADVTLGNWSWSYTTAANENWIDGSTTGQGNVVSDGNVTGLQFVPPVLPRLSHGHAVATSPVHETVCFTLSGRDTYVHFLILGPGKINGHEGWVSAHIGVNCGYYYGLQAGHTYLVYYVPVLSQGSQVQVPGTHPGHVTFVS